MEHYLLVNEYLRPHIINDICVIITNILARLNAVKIFITPHYIDHIKLAVLMPFDILFFRGPVYSEIKNIFTEGYVGLCRYRPDKTISNYDRGYGLNKINFREKIVISEFRDYSRLITKGLEICGEIDAQVVKYKWALSDMTLCVKIYGAAETYKINVNIDHICADIYVTI